MSVSTIHNGTEYRVSTKTHSYTKYIWFYFLCFWLTFSRSEVQSVALRLASRVIAHHLQTCEEVWLTGPVAWALGLCALIYQEGVSGRELPQQAESLGPVVASTKCSSCGCFTLGIASVEFSEYHH